MKLLQKQHEIDGVSKNIDQLEISRAGAHTKKQFLENSMRVKQAGGVKQQNFAATTLPANKVENESGASIE